MNRYFVGLVYEMFGWADGTQSTVLIELFCSGGERRFGRIVRRLDGLPIPAGLGVPT